MAGSEEFYGAGHPATFTVQPPKPLIHGELSGEAFGENQSGFDVEPKQDPNAHDHGPDQ